MVTPQASEFRTPAERSLVSGWRGILQRQPWLPFVLPLAVFMLSSLLEPSTQVVGEQSGEVAVGHSSAMGGAENSSALLSYPLAYTIRIGLTCLAVVLVWPAWRAIPLRVHPLAVPVGVVGVIGWILICHLQLEDRFLTAVGLGRWASWGDRPAFDPLAHFQGQSSSMVAFLAMRLAGLALIVPLVEEFFVRGFLMRFPLKADWWTIPLGSVTWTSGLIVVAYAVLSHPAEMIAAALWFTLITLLYARTRSLWDCVVAHAVTNGLLGAYILWSHEWTLW